MKDDSRSEQQLIEDSKKDPKHFEPLYKKYYAPILRFIYKRIEDLEDCRDVAAQVFTKALLNINSYRDMGFPFSSWLYKIAVNEINQFYRNSSKLRIISIDQKGIKHISEETGQSMDDLRSALSTALQYLSEDEMQLIELRFFEERPFSEVGQILEITENNAKVKTYRLLDKLREIYTRVSN